MKYSMNNIECYKCHNYGHIARNYRYNMKSTMNEYLDHENKKVCKGKQVHDEKVQDDREKKEGNQIPTFMLSRFVTDCKKLAATSVNDSSQDCLLNDTLF